MTWNSLRTDAVVGMVTSNVTFPGFNGDTIHAYAARPEGSGPFPSVVFVPHLGGWDEFCRESVRRLARIIHRLQSARNGLAPNLLLAPSSLGAHHQM